MSRRKESTSAPQWSYIVAAIVAVGTLAWSVVSHFVDKGSDKPTFDVKGNDNIAVGQMRDGNITNHASTPPTTAPSQEQR